MKFADKAPRSSFVLALAESDMATAQAPKTRDVVDTSVASLMVLADASGGGGQPGVRSPRPLTRARRLSNLAIFGELADGGRGRQRFAPVHDVYASPAILPIISSVGTSLTAGMGVSTTAMTTGTVSRAQTLLKDSKGSHQAISCGRCLGVVLVRRRQSH
jgi:hypothetical protein